MDKLPREATALYLYLNWCRTMRLQYETAMGPLAARFSLKQLNREAKKAGASGISSEEWIHSVHSDSFRAAVQAWPYQNYWFASLYVVIEGWEQIGLRDKDVDPLRNTENRDLLRRYRNAILHFQPDFTDTRFTDFIFAHRDTYPWAAELTDALVRFFTLHPQHMAGISIELHGLDMMISGAEIDRGLKETLQFPHVTPHEG